MLTVSRIGPFRGSLAAPTAGDSDVLFADGANALSVVGDGRQGLVVWRSLVCRGDIVCWKEPVRHRILVANTMEARVMI